MPQVGFNPKPVEIDFNPKPVDVFSQAATPTEEPSWYESLWSGAKDLKKSFDESWLNQPIMDFNNMSSQAAMRAIPLLNLVADDPTAQSITTGVSNLATPLNLGTAALSGGTSLAAKGGFPLVAKGLNWAEKASSVPIAAHGLMNVADPDSSMLQRGMGLLETVGGTFGMKSKVPSFAEVNPNAVLGKVDDVVEDLPLNKLDNVAEEIPATVSKGEFNPTPVMEGPLAEIAPKPNVIKLKKPTEELIEKARAKGYELTGVDEQGRAIMTLQETPEVNLSQFGPIHPDWKGDPELIPELFARAKAAKVDISKFNDLDELDNAVNEAWTGRKLSDEVAEADAAIKAQLNTVRPMNIQPNAINETRATVGNLKPTVGDDFTNALKGSLDQPESFSGWVKKLIDDESGSLEDLSKLKAIAKNLFNTDPKKYSNQKITTDIPTLRAEIENGLAWENGIVKAGKTLNKEGLYPKTTLIKEINSIAERRALEAELELLPKKGEVALGSKRGRQLETKRNFLIRKINELIDDESGEFDLDKLKKGINKIRSKMSTVGDMQSQSQVEGLIREFDYVEDQLSQLPSTSKYRPNLENQHRGLLEQISRFIKDESGEADLGRLKELFNKARKNNLTPEELNEAKTLAKQIGKPIGQTNEGRGVPSNKVSNAGLADDGPIDPTPESQAVLDKIPESERPSLPAEVWNLTRGIIPAGDLTSIAFRQARPLMLTKAWWKSWNNTVKAFGSEEASNIAKQWLNNHPLVKPSIPVIENGKAVLNKDGTPKLISKVEQLGLSLTDFVGKNREETRIASTWPETKLGPYSRVIRASNRAATTFANEVRVRALDTMLSSAQKMGLDPDSNLVVARDIAKLINDMSGRGSLAVKAPDWLANKIPDKFDGLKEAVGKEYSAERYAGLANTWLFSPRLASAQARMYNRWFNPLSYVNENPVVRQQKLKALVAVGGFWTSLATIGKLSGADVSLNPTSSDFGKIKTGKLRLEVSGGMGPWLVAASRLAMGESTSSESGKTKKFGSNAFAATPSSVVGEFAYNKLHPTARFALDLGRASNLTGEGGYRSMDLTNPNPMKNDLAKQFQFMVMQDLYSIAEEDPSLLPWLTLPVVSGMVNAQRYGKGVK